MIVMAIDVHLNEQLNKKKNRKNGRIEFIYFFFICTCRKIMIWQWKPHTHTHDEKSKAKPKYDRRRKKKVKVKILIQMSREKLVKHKNKQEIQRKKTEFFASHFHQAKKNMFHVFVCFLGMNKRKWEKKIIDNNRNWNQPCIAENQTR